MDFNTNCFVLLKLTTDRHEALRGLFATAELFVTISQRKCFITAGDNNINSYKPVQSAYTSSAVLESWCWLVLCGYNLEGSRTASAGWWSSSSLSCRSPGFGHSSCGSLTPWSAPPPTTRCSESAKCRRLALWWQPVFSPPRSREPTNPASHRHTCSSKGVARWLSGRASDLRSKSRAFEARPRRCCATTLGKLFTPYCLCHQAV